MIRGETDGTEKKFRRGRGKIQLPRVVVEGEEATTSG